MDQTVRKARIIDIPLSRWTEVEQEAQEQAKRARCEYTTTDGRRCELAVWEGYRRCRQHEMWRGVVSHNLGMPFPEDAMSLQELLGRVLLLISGGVLQPQVVKPVVTLCKLMQANLPSYERERARALKGNESVEAVVPDERTYDWERKKPQL